jgi:hypothetical protein
MEQLGPVFDGEEHHGAKGYQQPAGKKVGI